MNKLFYTTSAIAALMLSLDACKSKNKPQEQEPEQNIETVAIDAAHNTRNSIDWGGLYTGVIPCADCPGINVQIALNLDETYQISYQYIDRDTTPEVASGKFTWDNAGSIITLDNNVFPPYYKVGENILIQLDMSGQEITGEQADLYILTKEIE